MTVKAAVQVPRTAALLSPDPGLVVTAAGDVGIGIAEPLGKLHVVKSAVAGSIPNVNASALVIEDNGEEDYGGGITLFCRDGGSSLIAFGTPSDSLNSFWEFDATDYGLRGPYLSYITNGTFSVFAAHVELQGSTLQVFGHGTGAVQQPSGADLVNNVTPGGVSDTVADITDLINYAADAATIRDNLYQLARKLKQVNDALRAYGLLT